MNTRINDSRKKGGRPDTQIDFVITWVDGQDPEWQAVRNQYAAAANEDGDHRRYRDWELLKYWFRSVEKYAPWVRKIFFVTWGHLPEWLDTKAEKLVIIRHEDFIPKEYLPTFNSHTIEHNFHRIPGLSEQFVYFNDDVFLLRPVQKELFFKNGLPRHPAVLHPIFPRGYGGIAPHIYVNTVMAVNRHFVMKESLKRDWHKWFSLKGNGAAGIVENLYNMNFPEFPGFKNLHTAIPARKATFEEIWMAEGDALDKTCLHRFRNESDISIYLARYWELASGMFEPVPMQKLGKRFDIIKDPSEICACIRKQSSSMLCVNDMGLVEDPEEVEFVKQAIKEAFDSILPKPSSFETVTGR